MMYQPATNSPNSLEEHVERLVERLGATSAPAALRETLREELATIVAGLERVMREENKAAIQRLSSADTLTGLPNRDLFQHRLRQVLADTLRSGQESALLFLDLDRFKVINDTLGDASGDLLIREIAERLLGALGPSDHIARIGGDSFAIIRPGLTASEDASRFAGELLAALSEPLVLDGHDLFVTASIGYALFPTDGGEAMALSRNAETAMYRAKERRNFCMRYESAMGEAALERLSLESQLHKALDRNEFLLHYQPQVDLRTGRVVGAEALIRWRHPELDLVSPAKFIPLAEETGLILPMTDWAIRSACEQAKAWREMGLPPLRVAVNISGSYFRQPNVAERIQALLAELDLPASTLDLELTESIFMGDLDSTLATLKALREMGVSVSIDDFGTGYSSLSYLKRFPIGMLKIDQSFVRDVPRDADSAAIVQTIVLLAHSLNMSVIAEGVETAEQLAFLQGLNCDEVQGYHLSRPLPVDSLTQLLRQGPDLRRAM
ncbi:bifunctional diguanylate cyclase/phosphodiesterase [bacterium]|nr:bifunctional diguanylate cyclase/phosphodiesterase [bacterium]